MAGSRKIRRGELAAAINTTPKSLENWFARYEQVRPKAAREGTWLEFSWGDVASFAITVYLVELGMAVPAAFTHAVALVERRWPRLFDDTAYWTLTARNMRADFDFGFGPQIGGRDKWKGMIETTDAKDFADQIAKGLNDTKHPMRATVTFWIGHIVNDAFMRLAKMGHAMPVLIMGRAMPILMQPEKPNDGP